MVMPVNVSLYNPFTVIFGNLVALVPKVFL